MVKRVFGKVDGIEVNYDHSKGTGGMYQSHLI